MRDGKHVILCVDDDDDILESLQIILEASGYIVERASSAEEGLKRYKAVQPDLVLCDLMMEEVDAGTNFAKELRFLGNEAPVFMLSSVGDNLNRNIDYSALGLNGVLQKPIQPKTLLALLKVKLSDD
ncbi:response regulator [Myxococcota bacterium]|nr:response regulator [Myxococcota bacterium]MBU1431921.1 response regulator [Myxococcota bacterium]MBU1900431.1 response regulator [Myxococcota bacterium]